MVSQEPVPLLPDLIIEPIIKNALLEDLGHNGDVTTRAVVPSDLIYEASLNTRDSGTVSGMQAARLAFLLVDHSLEIQQLVHDGYACSSGQQLMTIKGSASSILMAERVALNFAGRLSGIATKTASFVSEVDEFETRITCTRKTTPGLRLLEKQAVLHGGGYNHRINLGDAILIKDNHIAAAGGINEVLDSARHAASHMMRIEIEVDTLEQLQTVLENGKVDVVLLDNMDTKTLRQAVEMAKGRLVTEASGNMTLSRLKEVAATGVDYISSGALTHSVSTLDLGLDF